VGVVQIDISSAGKAPVLFLLIGLLLAFFLVRLSTRLSRAGARWRIRSVKHRGLHVHHMVFGIIGMIIIGILQFAFQPHGRWLDCLAFIFGGGIGLVLDEFALVLHLKDVYWEEEGRTSIDAVVLAATLTGLLLLGLTPTGFRDGIVVAPSSARWVLITIAALNLAPVIVAMLKGRVWIGLVGVFVPGLALIGALRLATPRSPWAHSLYGIDSEKLHEARARGARTASRKLRVWDLIGGAPSCKLHDAPVRERTDARQSAPARPRQLGPSD
jgi:hypothetical protein